MSDSRLEKVVFIAKDGLIEADEMFALHLEPEGDTSSTKLTSPNTTIVNIFSPDSEFLLLRGSTAAVGISRPGNSIAMCFIQWPY